MQSINDTIERLARARVAGLAGVSGTDHRHLRALGDFGANPGTLSGWYHVSEGTAAMPLVVVLHGCTQDAASYDRGSGWSDLAARFGFAVVFAEQSRANNPNGCFNWFVPGDTRRDAGEAASIRQMIAAMVDQYPIDPARIFITGLSAGGAMASVMLATYPELFRGGAIIAGLPFGAAATMSQALERMRGQGHLNDLAYATAVRTASSHRGPWPRVSVWLGDADHTVNPVNADRIVGQWRALHGVDGPPDVETVSGKLVRRAWHAPDGSVLIEEHRIAGMGHGTPVATHGDTACGSAMPHMLDVGISSTWQIAHGWGLLEGAERARSSAAPAVPPAAPVTSIQATIEAALRSAGLMR
ncbi:PHB depolymerase family esterase [Sphingomonas sp.]|uniref:extracellular catalytic domain type 1 short-chain-length polyhydroxyalkanoate depolymerase n=1 Tax=Sphingomonas sp. TaxID=28214 RepID=UPI003340741E